MTGKRHIWLWQLFQIYGPKIRVAPNLVLFCHPEAYADIYNMKANVRRSQFYTAMKRNMNEHTTLNTVDVAEHAHKRKLLNMAFSEASTHAASKFIVQNIARWNEIMLEENPSSTEWSAPQDLSKRIDALTFDIMGDLCFGRSFDIKEPGENPLKAMPHNIAEYMKAYYPLIRSPFVGFLIWLKPRGLDYLFDLLSPPSAIAYNKFVYDSVTQRIQRHHDEAQMAEEDRRRDLFYFMCEARDPDTGLLAYEEIDLRAEANLLIIAGSDTTAISLSGIFYYLTGSPRHLQKLTDEVRTTFSSVDDIVPGPKLMNFTYLRACIDEGMRMTPTGPCESPREVLEGGMLIRGEYYPPGTIVGTPPWCGSRNEEVYGDAGVYRPERWIVDEENGVTRESISRLKANFHPFLSGPGSCVGKNLALNELLVTVARTLHRLDIRRAPGSTLGCGSPELGWGARDKTQFQLGDAYISLREGPEIQFKRRADAAVEGQQ